MIDGKLRAESGKGLWNDVKRAFLLAASFSVSRSESTRLSYRWMLPFLLPELRRQPQATLFHACHTYTASTFVYFGIQSPTITDRHSSPVTRFSVAGPVTLNPHEDSAPFIPVHLLVLCIGLLSARVLHSSISLHV